MDYVSTVLADLPGTGSFWPYNEASSHFVDSGGGAHNSTVETAISYQQPGPLTDGSTNYSIGLANASFSKTSYGDIFDFTGTTSFSLEIWIKPTTLTGTVYLFNNLSAAGTDGWRLRWDINGGANTIFFNRDLAGAADSINWNVGAAGKWSYVVATYDGTNQRGYYNGNLIAGPTASSKSLVSVTDVLDIGNFDSSTTLGFDGNVAFPAIYPSVALSAAQVLAHYQIGHPPDAISANLRHLGFGPF